MNIIQDACFNFKCLHGLASNWRIYKVLSDYPYLLFPWKFRRFAEQILFSFNFSIFYVISIALRVHILVYLLKGNQSCSASCVKLEKHN